MTVYTWRDSVQPVNQYFRGGGTARQGGMTLGGFTTTSPEPGGRGEVFLDFATMVTEQANRDASWLLTKLRNGNLFRYRLLPGAQHVPDDDLTVPDEGLPWGNEATWGNGSNWAANPWVPVTAPALEGEVTVRADLGGLGQVLQVGHVIGFYLDGEDFCHIVDDIEYTEADVATITISPPLRRDITPTDEPADAALKFRPSIVCTCPNADAAPTNYARGMHMQINSLRLVEALV